MNTINELRKMAERMLSEHPRNLNADEWGGSFKKLLEELSIYQIELEHQNRELERSEKELARAHEEYVKLFESTPVGYVILDANKNIVRANQTFVNYFVSASMKNSMLEGATFESFVVDEFKNSFSLFCKMVQKQKVPIPLELKLRDRHNKPHFVLLTARSYDLEKKQIALTASDISMQKRMEEQLAKAKEEAEEADRKKSRFLTNISHELRTPLSTIIGYGLSMNDPEVSLQEKYEFSQSIVTTSQQLMRFSDDVLDISSLESGETPLRNQVVDIKKICDESSQILSRKLIGKNVLINTRTGNVPMLWTDGLRIRQIVHSVLEHATENAAEGEVVLASEYISEEQKHGRLRLTFSGKEVFSSENDFDQGISNNLALRNHATLGLFLVKRIVKAMKGLMIWEHPLDKLCIEIPVELSPFLDAPTQKIVPVNEQNDSAEPAEDEKRNCLLVDDVAMNLKILELMMKKIGYNPTLAMSGEEALKLVKENHFSLILTDLWMPEMNGEELALMLRQNPDLDNVPIYAVTADVENSNHFNMEFFDGTVIKPVNIDKLRMIISSRNTEQKQNLE